VLERIIRAHEIDFTQSLQIVIARVGRRRERGAQDAARDTIERREIAAGWRWGGSAGLQQYSSSDGQQWAVQAGHLGS